MIGFTIASMLCGAAQTLPQLVMFRALQGVFGASLVPLSQALMMEAYTREEQGKAMAMWGVGTMLGPDHRPDARRLADRRVFLALGVLHQPAGRHPVRDRPDDPDQEQGERQAAAVRPAGLHPAVDRHRHLPAHARPRRDRSTGSAPRRSSSRRSVAGVAAAHVRAAHAVETTIRSCRATCSATAT